MATDSSPGSSVDLPNTARPTPATGKRSSDDKRAGKQPAEPAPGKLPASKVQTAASAATLKTDAVKAKPAQAAAPAGADKAPAGADKPPAGADKGATTKGAAKRAAAKRTPPRTSSAREELEELEKVGALTMVTMVPAWLISAIVHLVILLIFGLMVMPPKEKEVLYNLVALGHEKNDELEEMEDLTVDTPIDLDTQPTEAVTSTEVPVEATGVEATEVVDAPAATAAIELADIGLPTAPKSDLVKEVGSFTGTGLSGRGDAAMRKQIAISRGGSEASEKAVALALKWLTEHQNGDGSWSFDHRNSGKCQNRCSGEGKLNQAYLAATGLALMPYLGAGQTHKKGQYKEQVRAGLDFLVKNMKPTPNGGDMTGGGGAMYGHGICSIALCEAYAMTQDKDLLPYAQASLNFIMYAQDPVGGGWRYQPRTPGDTSVVGWQIMALKSGFLGYLQVDPMTVKRASKFLDSVQADGGSHYGYDKAGAGPATTAVGLLCRMYLGWKHDNPALERGVQYLSNTGPQINGKTANMYFNYYATQVLHQYEGDAWEKWNQKMRDALVGSQSQSGHETGSWLFTGDVGAEQGGRLYYTSMATMTLEVYYRYMPIYTKKSSEDDFED